MRRLPANVLRLVALLATLSWLGGSIAQLAHAALVQHVVCDEHGEVVELAEGAQHHDVDRVEIAVPDAEDHGHGCDFEHATFTAASLELPAAPVPALVPVPTTNDLVRAAPPRGPPLAYAPKTSPPLA